MKYEEPLMMAGGSEIAANGLRFLLNSLTPNAKEVFRVLAEHQLAHPNEIGLSYKAYFETCQSKFLVWIQL